MQVTHNMMYTQCSYFLAGGRWYDGRRGKTTVLASLAAGKRHGVFVSSRLENNSKMCYKLQDTEMQFKYISGRNFQILKNDLNIL